MKDLRNYKRYCAVLCWQGVLRSKPRSAEYNRYYNAWCYYIDEVIKEEPGYAWVPTKMQNRGQRKKKPPRGGGNP